MTARAEETVLRSRETLRRILERRELDALAVVCKAADFEKPLFLTFAVLTLDREANAMGRAKEYSELYAELPRESAQRIWTFANPVKSAAFVMSYCVAALTSPRLA